VFLCRLFLLLEALARQRMQIVFLQFEIDLLNILAQPLEHEVQAITPLAKTVLGLCEHPGDATHRWKIHLAGIASKFA
jgi:hypothetical protein